MLDSRKGRFVLGLVARRKRKQLDGTTILRFTAEHLWVRADGERAQIGLSDHAQAALGEVIAIELPGMGEEIERGSTFGEVESVRTVQELIAPISGVVTAVNEDLGDHAELLNEDPYHEGWLIEVKIGDESELDDLIPVEEYEESVSAD
jgi:glycine cleavage system H protein